MKWYIKISREGKTFHRKIKHVKGMDHMLDGRIAQALIQVAFEVCWRDGYGVDEVTVSKGGFGGRPRWTLKLD